MLELISSFVLGFIVCKVYISFGVYKENLKLEQQITEKLAELKSRIIPSRIEEADDGSLFLYNSDTNEFLGQGKTADELETNVKKKFPNKLFNIPPEQLNKYMKEENA